MTVSVELSVSQHRIKASVKPVLYWLSFNCLVVSTMNSIVQIYFVFFVTDQWKHVFYFIHFHYWSHYWSHIHFPHKWADTSKAVFPILWQRMHFPIFSHRLSFLTGVNFPISFLCLPPPPSPKAMNLASSTTTLIHLSKWYYSFLVEISTTQQLIVNSCMGSVQYLPICLCVCLSTCTSCTV